MPDTDNNMTTPTVEKVKVWRISSNTELSTLIVDEDTLSSLLEELKRRAIHDIVTIQVDEMTRAEFAALPERSESVD